MTKSPEAFRTISEVAEALAVPPHVLRFWETRFPQVKPVKRGGGRRYYRPEDVRLLRGIRGLLYDDGITIKGVQKILRERGVRHVISLGTLADGADGVGGSEAGGLVAKLEDVVLSEVIRGSEAAEPPAAPSEAIAAEPPEAQPPDVAPAPPSPSGRQEAPAATVPAGPQKDSPVAADDTTDLGDGPEEFAEEEDAAPIRPPEAMDKAALRRLVEQLQALRCEMMAEPTAE